MENDEQITSNVEATGQPTPQENTSTARPKRTSEMAQYFTRDEAGNYSCNLCEEDTPPKKVVIKKDRTGSTNKLWRHIERKHLLVYREHKPLHGQPSVANIFPRKNNRKNMYIGRTPDQCKERAVSLLVHTDVPFSFFDHPEAEIYLSYYAQRDVKPPSSTTVRRALTDRFTKEQSGILELFKSVDKVSLTTDCWTSENQVAIMGMTIHWIDNSWALRERVLGVEELVDAHTGPNMAEVLMNVLKNYNLQGKVCAITTDNASNNKTMATSLEKLLKNTGSRFTKEYNTRCMAHIINLAIQGGLKELGTERKKIEDLQNLSTPRSQGTFSEIITRLRQLVIASQGSPLKKKQYKTLCDELDMPNDNKIDSDVPTRWNSTHNMLEAAWHKRDVLNNMVSRHLNPSKVNLSISSKEWDLLKNFGDSLVSFRDGSELLCKSKSITASSVLRVFKVLLEELDSFVDELDHLPSSKGEKQMTDNQSNTLRRTYKVMREKLLKYEYSVRRRPCFVVATVLDPTMKLTDIACDDQDAAIQHVLALLEALPTHSNVKHAPKIDSESISGMTSKPSRMKRAFSTLKAQSKCLDVSPKDELNTYLAEPLAEIDALDWWRKSGCDKYPRLAILAKEFLAICATSASSERLFSTGRGIVTYKRSRLNADTVSMLMTLKCWFREDDTNDLILVDD